MSNKSIQLAEIQLLNHLIRNPHNIEACEDNYFITEIGLDIFGIIKSLDSRGVKVVDAHILSEASKVSELISQDLLSKIHDVEVEDEKSSFDLSLFINM